MTLLFLTRISTVPSGSIVKVIRSPAFMLRLSRMSLGIVVCPLLVSVESLLMMSSFFLTNVDPVRMECKGRTALLPSPCDPSNVLPTALD